MQNMKAKDAHKSTNYLNLAENEQTGFPSPANDHLEHTLSLDELIVKRPASTFYVRAEGNEMNTSGIRDQDLLVVDRSVKPSSGQVVIVAIEEECLVRKLIIRGGHIYLISDQNDRQPIRVKPEMNWIIWGTVTHVIRNMTKA
ncbi:LexA family protein [Balneola sp. MJW-20]|uniref:LexA family protein n=1 Tax=Gracilimonas aurantiaca TaxID=3234185 RepID=UPI003467367E